MVSRWDSTTLRKFIILLYKGWLLRKRHYIVTAFEIFIPVLVASIPAIIQSQVDMRDTGGWVNETTYPLSDPLTSGQQYRSDCIFAYAPSNKWTDTLVTDALQLWKDNHKGARPSSKSLTEIDDLENFCIKQLHDNKYSTVIGTVFNNIQSSAESPPPNLDYTIRYCTIYPPRFSTDMKYRFPSSYDTGSTYSSTNFLSWQAAVERTFIQKHLEKKSETFDYELWMQTFPFPRYKQGSVKGSFLKILLPLVLTYGFIIFSINIIRRVIEEKSNGSKELMKMMGMTDFIYWASTFLNYFTVGAVVFLIITIIYKAPLPNSTVLLTHSNFLLVFFLFMLYMASLILFCLALSTFFNKAVFGIIFLIILYNVVNSLLTSFVFPFNQSEMSYFPLSSFAKFAICLVPPGALLSICEFLADYEELGEGVVWANLYTNDVVYGFSVSSLMLSLLFSCLLYVIIIWYIDAVWPWQYGVPQPIYFPFTKSYWCGYKKGDGSTEDLLGSENEFKNADYFEDDPSGISPGVVLNRLSKVFRTGFQTKVAVNNVSLNIFTGEITALLGHNGAGKTTTINILTGLYKPSSGTASINGWDIFTHTSKARQSLGVCPQHNVLYDTLTVEEHLKLYAALKGVSWSQLNKETTAALNTVHLTDKRTELAKNLSGGMKRKLSLAIAIIGGSKVLFLDEPTSGMDVEARRSVWDALLSIRHNHTIILTTHYMEEADILGDRIAIMADGEVRCSGSPLFLKKKFGTGYHLHLVKRENFNLNVVNGVLKKYIPEATLEHDYEGEVTFNLMSDTHSNFGPLFEEMETNKDVLGVNSCGITVTTMDDVFLNVASEADLKKSSSDSPSVENAEELEMTDIYIESNQFGKSAKFSNQFLGLFMKRLHYSKRHWGIVVSQLILPFIIICICLTLIVKMSSMYSEGEPALKLDVSQVYGKTDGFYQDPSKAISEMEKVYKENDIDAKPVSDPNKFILNYGQKNKADYLKKLMVGGTADAADSILNLTAWFNGYPYHAEPMSLLLMDTAILRKVTKSGRITLTNHPFPSPAGQFYGNDHFAKKILANVFFPLALSFLSASFVLVPIHERATRAKLLQMMTGLVPAMYWFVMFVWDFMINTILSILLIIPFAIFTHYAFFSPHSEAIGTAILLLILYGWSSIPFSYLISLIFKKPNTGFSVVVAIVVLIGVGGSSIISTVTIALGRDLTSAPKVLKFFYWFLKIFPSYAMASGFGNLFEITFANAFCDTLTPQQLKFNCKDSDPSNPLFKCCKDICGNQCMNSTNPLTMEPSGVGPDILFLFGDGIFYFLLLLLLESSYVIQVFYRLFEQLRRQFRVAHTPSLADSFVEDSDVLQEEERIKNNFEMVSNNDALFALNLTKIFKNIIAVDRVTFGIHKKECFGLLGVNGAGKTTTFRMLTGDCYPSDGNAYIGSFSVSQNLKKFQSNLGYCPQFDALIDRLSARETITLFARLRGLSGPSMTRYVNALIKMTDLTQYADKPSMVYSGGNKRKLSIALALIGAPPLLLLDEPTAGVDPVSRRKIWKILSLARIHSGAAVILTTHSMEESEALCSRLAIMVNGRFRCLGSIQHLKSKFGEGYTLIIKMNKEAQYDPQAMSAIKAYIDTNLPGAHLKDDHQGMLQYHVVDPSITLSRLFRFMDEMKTRCNLEDYVISDTSLEQIFLVFARSQRVVAS